MKEPRLVVVTATADAKRFGEFAHELDFHADGSVPIVAVAQKFARWLPLRNGVIEGHNDYLGVVPAFARGCEIALRTYPRAEVIACLHDDLLVSEPDWDQKLLAHFDTHPDCGLAGFGGAWGLGDEQAGQGIYRPTWLVRRGFMSNMQDAEAHGTRVTEPRKIACLDGFSQVFRRTFLQGRHHNGVGPNIAFDGTLFSILQDWGVMHHAYDAATGAFARYLSWDTWLLPFAVHHKGGQTAVGDAQYNEWARTHAQKLPDSTSVGDQVFWEQAHKIIWQRLGHLLPFEVDRLG
jgi:hypothetical protein